MHHQIALISTIAVGLVYALTGGYIASRLRLPPLIGYLLAVRNVAVPGALVQVAVAVALTCGVARLWGWSLGASLVLGLALSVASTSCCCAPWKRRAFSNR